MAKERETILVVGGGAPLKDAFSCEYDLVEADSCASALCALEDTPAVSAVLLDFSQAEGRALLAAMKKDVRGKGVSALALVRGDDGESQLLALDAGADDVLPLPEGETAARLARRRLALCLGRRGSSEALLRSAALAKQLRASETDPKTGIYTQQTFCRKTEELLRANRDKRFILLRFDIDNFKLYNDAFGIAEGDRLLRRFGECCRDYAKPGMTYGHYEADHFVICMERADFSEQRLLPLIMTLKSAQHSGFELTVRVGAYAVDDAALPVALMCDRALMALRSIKGDYTERIAYYSDEMRLSMIEEQEIVNDMGFALESGQFAIYLQPQYNQADGSLYGAEALVRWRHPVKGMIQPSKFIPVFERNGFISELDRYVLEETCRLQRRWLDGGLPVVPVSVNLSRRNLYSEELCDFITGTLEKYGIERELIALEITESAYMENPRQLIDVVRALRERGFSVEMDDFGSGYSSLNTLKDVPVNILKLDMNFMTGSMSSPRGDSILASIIRMAHWLKLPVIAEGVETKLQADYLKSIGCLYIQGYYFDRPMPAEEFETRLRGQRPDLMRGYRFTEDVKGAMDFLSASTQSALLFNSFVGGAGIVEFDGENVEGLRFNDRFYETVGISQSDYQEYQLSMRERFDDKNWQIYIDAIRRAIDTRDESVCEIQTKPLGERREPVWTRTRMRFLAQNERRYILYISVDNINQNMRLLEKNTQLSEQLSTVMDSVPGGILNFEARGGSMRITFSNETLAAMFGYGHEEYMSLFAENPYLVIHPDDRDAMIPKATAAFAGGSEYVDEEYRHLCRDGGSKWVRLSSKIVRREDGGCYGSGIVMNIDEEIRVKNKAEAQAEQLKRRHLALKALYDTIPCGILEFTMEGGKAKLTGFNDTAWRIFGYDTREDYVSAVSGRNAMLHVYPGDKETVERMIYGVSRGSGQRLVDFDYRILRTDGSVGWIRLYLQKAVYAEREATVQCVFMDVTAEKSAGGEKRAEVTPPPEESAAGESAREAVRRISERLGQIMRNIPSGIVIYEMRDDRDVPVYVSDQACKMLGLTREECELSIVNGEELDLPVGRSYFSSEDMPKLLAGETVSTQRIKVRRRDGGAVWLRSSANAVKQKSGVVTVYAVLTDITQSVADEKTIETQSSELAAIIDSVPGGIFKYSAQSDEFSYISDNLLTMLGYTRAEFDRKFHNKFSEMIWHEDREEAIAKINSDIAATGDTDSCEYRIETKSGHLKWVYDVGRLITAANGEQWYIVAVIDHDDKKAYETRLTALNSQISAMIKNSPGGIASFRVNKNRWLPEYASDALIAMLGYGKEELSRMLSGDILNIVHPQDRANAAAAIAGAGGNDNSFSGQYRLRRRNGDYIWVAANGNFVGGKGMCYMSFMDISNIKRMEEQLSSDKQQIETIVNSIPGGVATYELRADGKYLVYASDGVGGLSGRTSEEYRRMTNEERLSGIYPPDERKVAETLRQAMETWEEIDINYRITHVNGTLVWLNLRGRRTGERNGNPVFLAVFHNLSSTTELYQHILAETAVALVVADAYTREVLFVNRSAEKLSGITAIGAKGMSCYKYIYGREAPCPGCDFETQTEWTSEFYRERDGRYYKVRRKNIDWNGRAAFISYITDITLERSMREQVDNVIRNIPGGLVVFRVQNGEVKRTYLSGAARALLGWSEEDTPETELSDVLSRVHGGDKARVEEELRSAIAEKKPFYQDYRIMSGNETRWVNLNANPVEGSGGALYFYGIYTDITERRLEEERAARTRQAQLERYRSEIKNLSAVQSDNLLAKLYMDLTTGELISSAVNERDCAPYDGLTCAQALRQASETCLNDADKSRLLALFSRDHAFVLLSEQSDAELSFEYQRVNRTGRICWVQTTARAFCDPESGHVMAFLFTYDVDDKKMPTTMVERLLVQNAELLGLINAKTGVLHAYISTDMDNMLGRGNDWDYNAGHDSFAETWVEPESQAEARHALALQTVIERLSSSETSYRCSFWLVKGGARAHKSWVFSYLDEGRTNIIVMRNDTTGAFLANEQNRRELQLALEEVESSKLDNVTGVYNRAATMQEIDARLSDESVADFAVVMLDVDDLKRINDTFGHPQGDFALASLAKLLRRHFRGSDIIGRVGGDEFMVFMNGAKSKAALSKKLEALIKDANKTMIDEKSAYPVRCSAGVTFGRHGERSFEEFYSQADKALYKAKQSGKNRFEFYA